MLNGDEKKLIVKICKLYYFHSWTQEKIANKFGVSRPVISKLLQKARDEGIVEIIIHDDTFDTFELEHMIENAFGLKEVVIVPTMDMNEEQRYGAVGRAASQYVLKLLNGQIKRIGISWGTTLYHVIKEFPYENKKDVKVIPLVGGIGTRRIEIHSNQLAYELSKKINGTCESLYAPAIVETEELKNQLYELPNIASVIEEGKKIDLALLGIGNPFANSTMEQIGYLNRNMIRELKKAGAVGDINSRFIDADGSVLNHPINNKVIGIELEHLRKIPNVVGVALGAHKADSILSALKGRYLSAFVTDEQTATELVNRIR